MNNFEIKTPYITGPNIAKNLGPAFVLNPNKEILRQKEIEIKKFGSDLYGVIDVPDIKETIRKASILCGRQETDDIVNLGLQFEEDFAIMQDGVLAAICFCFPSSWIPSERLGQTLEAIHGPVADADRLRSVSQRMAAMMTCPSQGSFYRQVWTICNSGELSQHPKNKTNQQPKDISDLYFRLETQTTLPLGDKRTSLFFVNVETCPLVKIWDVSEKRNQIMASIDSMSENILTYKNLHEIKKLLKNNMV